MTVKGIVLAIAKVVGIVAVLLIVLAIYASHREQQEQAAYQQHLHELMKPDPQHWQIINATRSDGPAAWAINSEDGTVMYCTADAGSAPTCTKSG